MLSWSRRDEVILRAFNESRNRNNDRRKSIRKEVKGKTRGGALMEQLIRVIGKAPSELPPEELLTKLRAEHLRVSEGLANWREAQIFKGRKTSTKEASSLTKIKAMEKELGMTMEELLELAKNGES